MADSDIAASQLGAVILHDIDTTNGGDVFGLAANRIAALTIYQGKNVTTTLTIQTSTSSGYRIGDFIVREI